MIRLTQHHLKILENCPRQFEYTYCDRLTLPIPPDLQAKAQLGKDFHLLMQQRELGLPIEPILAKNLKLKIWVESIIKIAPTLFESDPQVWRESEHLRTLLIDNYLFSVVYDLVILQTNHAAIIDWKTYPLPKYKKDLDQGWQTKLYLYALAETSAYLPKQINFTYWFIQTDPQPKSVQISYNLKKHRQTQTELVELTSKLTNWLDEYQTKGVSFPQVAASTGCCQQCHFAPRCGRD